MPVERDHLHLAARHGHELRAPQQTEIAVAQDVVGRSASPLSWWLASSAAHIRNTPKRVSGIGAFSAADMPKASTVRVSAGAITPSSHSRAVE